MTRVFGELGFGEMGHNRVTDISVHSSHCVKSEVLLSHVDPQGWH